MDQSDAIAHRTNEQHSPLNRGGTLPFHYRGHWARNSIHLRPLANEAESSQSQKLAADHPGENQSAQRNSAAWDGYESCHHGQKKQYSKMKVKDQDEVQQRETLAKRARYEKNGQPKTCSNLSKISTVKELNSSLKTGFTLLSLTRYEINSS